MRYAEQIELEFEKRFGKLVIKSFAQYYGGYKRQAPGGIVSPINPGMMYLFKNYFVFAADTAKKENYWEIVIPMGSIIDDDWQRNELNENKFNKKSVGIIHESGKKLFLIPFIDDNGIYHEPKFGIMSVPGWKKALGCAAAFGGGGMTKWNQVFFDTRVEWKRNNPISFKQKSDLSKTEKWDVFISHATEDKENVARPLAEKLKELGLEVWYDEWNMKWGKSLRASIDDGLKNSLYGVVILSREFFLKTWTKIELDGLISIMTTTGRDNILPLKHNITQQEVNEVSPTLGGIFSRSWNEGLEKLANEIKELVGERKKSVKI